MGVPSLNDLAGEGTSNTNKQTNKKRFRTQIYVFCFLYEYVNLLTALT